MDEGKGLSEFEIIVLDLILNATPNAPIGNFSWTRVFTFEVPPNFIETDQGRFQFVANLFSIAMSVALICPPEHILRLLARRQVVAVGLVTCTFYLE
jgi:hypothetical protein